ncbi:hypothetical protein I4U23_004811 [Adineta vaga]|nr:hypothetical protein I4U23_004811 [Adineta vaga]
MKVRPNYKKYRDGFLYIQWLNSLKTCESIAQQVIVFEQDLCQLVDKLKDLTFLDIYGEIHYEKVEPYRLTVQARFPHIANDYMPWEDISFNQIAESFPFIETLVIANSKPQKNKLQLNNETDKLKITTFSRLMELRVTLAHMDYIERLMFNRCTHLPRLCQLEIDYK